MKDAFEAGLSGRASDPAACPKFLLSIEQMLCTYGFPRVFKIRRILRGRTRM
ncbi:hypothetical protein FA13DRAFT_1744788, partial [Coprinellus micaceus]